MKTKVRNRIKRTLAKVRVEETFSKRLAVVLANKGIQTLGTLLEKTDDELFQLGLGRKSVEDIRDFFEEVGICRHPNYRTLGGAQLRDRILESGYSEGVANLVREVLSQSRMSVVVEKELKDGGVFCRL